MPAHVAARTAHRKARRDRHEADHAKPIPKGLAKAIGWSPKAAREAEQAHRQAIDQAAQAKAWRHESGQLQKRMEAEAEKHFKALMDAWKKAHTEHIDRFPEQQTPTAPKPMAHGPTTSLPPPMPRPPGHRR
jgi:hypothetical protein